ncbi:MAG: hypothetical protein JST89_21935 [Cyanobacteria bacterium SZAS-4]|nr:hypothetical protein [Cyanobacteria bacterium SZAS-4]
MLHLIEGKPYQKGIYLLGLSDNMMRLVTKDIDMEELDKACWPIFQQLMEELGERYHNWIVVIEPVSKEYFLGQDDQEVLSRARKKHPLGVFFAYRLNENPAIDSL